MSAPDRIWMQPEMARKPQFLKGVYDNSGEVEYRRADLPPTPEEAMRCPEVQALVEAAKRARQQIVDYGGDGYASGLDTSLAAFPKDETK